MNKLTELKVKRKSLAVEAAIIRKEERKTLRAARTSLGIDYGLNEEDFVKRMLGYGYSAVQANRIWNSYRKSNRSTNTAALYHSYHSLHHHRVHLVRRAARYAHLAHAFLKERKYRTVEVAPKEPVNADHLAKHIKPFGGEYPPSVIARWLGQ